MSGAYTVSVTNAAGCVSSNVVNVIVNTLPVITPTNTGPYCAGTTINLTTPASVTYTWTGPNAFTSNLQNPTIPNSQAVHAGTYSLTVTNGGGCQSSGTTNVIVNPTPTATAANNGPICSGFALNLTGGGGGTYVWSGPGFNSHFKVQALLLLLLQIAECFRLVSRYQASTKQIESVRETHRSLFGMKRMFGLLDQIQG